MLAAALGKTQERERAVSMMEGGTCDVWAQAALGRKVEAQRQSRLAVVEAKRYIRGRLVVDGNDVDKV